MRLDHLLSKELPTLTRPVLAGGWVVQVPRHRRTCDGWLLMGGTLTKERPGLRWCQYPPARQALVVPSGVAESGVVVVEHRW